MRRTAGFWIVLVVLIATFAAEPDASLAVTRDALTAIGEFGGSLVVELSADDGGALEAFAATNALTTDADRTCLCEVWL